MTTIKTEERLDTMYDPSSPKNMLFGAEEARPSRASRNTTKSSKSRAERENRPAWDKDKVRSESKQNSAVKDIDPAWLDLANTFKSQPWIHKYLGETEERQTIPVAVGEVLIARMIRDRAQQDELLAKMDLDEQRVVIDYAMKHFFNRVPNEERGPSRILSRFLHEDWWDELIPESIDHQKTLKIGNEAFVRAAEESEAFYATWPRKESRKRGRTVSEALERFKEIYTARLAEQEAASEADEVLL